MANFDDIANLLLLLKMYKILNQINFQPQPRTNKKLVRKMDTSCCDVFDLGLGSPDQSLITRYQINSHNIITE